MSNCNTRIRYVRNPDGTSESLQIFKGTVAEYRALISADGRSGFVLMMPDRQIRTQVDGPSPHKIKIKLKASLKLLGVVFLNEKRTDNSTARGD